MLSVSDDECKALAVARPERGLSFLHSREKGKTMTVPKVSQQRITEAIDVVQWTARGDDVEAAAETRKRARQCGPDCVAFLHFVVRTDGSRPLRSVCVRHRAVGSRRVSGA